MATRRSYSGADYEVTRSFWTEERVAECKRLYIDEERSATVVAKMIGAASRCAIIGKAFRMGWEMKPGRKPPRLSAQEVLRRNNERRRLRRVLDGPKPRNQRAQGAPKPALEAPALTAVGGGGVLPERMDGNMPPDAAPVPFRHRPPNRCSWPIDAPEIPGTAETPCCGAPRVEGRPYCQAHEAQSRSRGPRVKPLDVKWLVNRFSNPTTPSAKRAA